MLASGQDERFLLENFGKSKADELCTQNARSRDSECNGLFLTVEERVLALHGWRDGLPL
jgi:hypothetical protein